MFKIACLSFAAILGGATLAQAQSTTRSYYGPSGGYQGSSTTTGNNTMYYGPSGSYQGDSTTTGNSTAYYGPSGSYQGSSTRR